MVVLVRDQLVPQLMLKRLEKAYITEVLNEKANSLRKTAEALEIHYSGLLHKLKKLEIAKNTTRSVSNG